MQRLRHRHGPFLSPARLAAVVFTSVIALVTLLLSMPFASADHTRTPLIDALFTAVSAVTVTGLTTVDTGSHWSDAGLVVIMIAIKIGGLGVLTLASLLSLSVMRHLGLAQRMAAATETRAEHLSDVGSVLRTIVITSTACEIAAFVALAPFMMITEHGTGRSLFLGLFYAISSFNNAGFVPEVEGTAQYLANPFFCVPVGVSVFLGSLGFPVLLVLARAWRTPSRWTLHTKITLSTSVALFFVSTFGIALFEWSNPETLGQLPLLSRLQASMFAAVMPRSGGFANLDVAAMHDTTRLFMDGLMFIGGGSGSTGGGIKVSTFAVLLLSVRAEARGDADVEAFGRRIPPETIRQAIGVLALSVLIALVATMLMLQFTQFTLEQATFEVLSAYGTVGLSMGITAQLPVPAKIVVISCMYVGRLGPMTIGAVLALRRTSKVVRLPHERPVIG